MSLADILWVASGAVAGWTFCEAVKWAIVTWWERRKRIKDDIWGRR